MNLTPFRRSILIFGEDFFNILTQKKVIIFGIGGVGSYTAEALARGGISHITLVDYDTVCITNINRQLIALKSTIGKNKTDVMKQRILDINPEAEVTCIRKFVTPENLPEFNLDSYDFVVDAIDNVTAKLALMETCHRKIPLISSMGTGNKFDPFLFKIGDISKTIRCPLARVIRKELKRRRISKGITVLYSTETPIKPIEKKELDCRQNCVCPHPCNSDVFEDTINCTQKQSIPGSNSYIPSIAGLMIASHVFNSFRKDFLTVNPNGFSSCPQTDHIPC